MAKLIALLTLYVVGFGPACWFDQRNDSARPVIAVLYRPIFSILLIPGGSDGIGGAKRLIAWYVRLGEAYPAMPVLSPNGELKNWMAM